MGKAFHESVIVCNEIFSQEAFTILQQKNFVFNTILTDHAIGKYILGLADTMGPVDGLLLDRRVPPGIHDIDVVRCGQIEPDPASLE